MTVQFCYSPEIIAKFPQLRSRALFVRGVDSKADSTAHVARLQGIADQRLATASEGELPEIQAWRRGFSAMGLKPTQYRCASEALLRRYRKEGALPRVHPLIDLCNATSLAFAIPIAVFDLARITGTMTVRLADSGEIYETFSGEIEHPESGEIIFADESGRAHARRWTNRQSGWSAVRQETSDAMIVCEALHETAGDDVAALTSSIVHALVAIWPTSTVAEMGTR